MSLSFTAKEQQSTKTIQDYRSATGSTIGTDDTEGEVPF